MLNGFTSSGSASDFDKAFRLIAAASDLEGVRLRLMEIQAKEQDAVKALADVKAGEEALAQARADFETMKSTDLAAIQTAREQLEDDQRRLANNLTLYERENAALTMSIASHNNDIKVFQAEKADHLAALSTTTAQLEEQSKVLDQRSADLEARETELKRQQDELVVAQAQHAEAVAQLQAALGRLGVPA